MRLSIQATPPREKVQDSQQPCGCCPLSLCTERKRQTVQPHKAVPTGGWAPEVISGAGVRRRPLPPPFPHPNPLSSLLVSTCKPYNASNAFVFPKLRAGEKADEEGALGSRPPPLSELSGPGGCEQMGGSGCAGLETSRPEVPLGPMWEEMKGPPRHLKSSQNAQNETMPSSPVLLGWTLRHLQGPGLPRGPDHLQEEEGAGLASFHPSVQTHPPELGTSLDRRPGQEGCPLSRPVTPGQPPYRKGGPAHA